MNDYIIDITKNRMKGNTMPKVPIVLVEIKGGNIQQVTTSNVVDVYVIDHDLTSDIEKVDVEVNMNRLWDKAALKFK